MLAAFIKKLVDDPTGTTGIEYGLIVSLIFLAIIVVVGDVAESTMAFWDEVNEKVGEAMNG